MTRKTLDVTIQTARRIVVAVTGTTLLLLGVAMIVLPGPAILILPAGLAVLATEFAWARRWLIELRHGSREALQKWGLAE